MPTCLKTHHVCVMIIQLNETHHPFQAYNTFANSTKSLEENIKQHFDRFNTPMMVPHRVTLAINASAIQSMFTGDLKKELGSIKV